MPIVIGLGNAITWVSIDNDAPIEQDFLLWEEPDGYFVTDATGIDRILLH
jgi:hypothetical protein